MVCQRKNFNNDDILYIIGKVLKALFNENFSKTLTEATPLRKPRKTGTILSNWYVKENF